MQQRVYQVPLSLAQRFGFHNPLVAKDLLNRAISGQLQNSQIQKALGDQFVLIQSAFTSAADLSEKEIVSHLETVLKTRENLNEAERPPLECTPIQSIFIPNRGEAASRLITAARTLSLERGQKIKTVVMYTDIDKDMPFVADADEAIRLTDADLRDVPDLNEDGTQKLDENGQPKTKKLLPYLDVKLIEQLIQAHQCDAVWPGWGFLSETVELSEAVQKLGIRFLGPGAEAISMVGDKIGFKQLMDPEGKTWSLGPILSEEHAVTEAERLGYPVVIKARAGGGGRGIKFSRNRSETINKLPVARSEAKLAFNNDEVYIEKAVLPTEGQRVRHIEVQVLADHHGNVVAVGDRDCSIQFENKKQVEEAPAPDLTPKQRRSIYDQAVAAVKKVGYRGGPATVEGLYIPEIDYFQPMELNARLQVEHTITEMVTGIDLVREMILIGEGRPLSFLETPPAHGHAIEVRINAENPDEISGDGFAKTGGTLRSFRPPSTSRVDSGVKQGSTILIGYDAMLAKLIVHKGDRKKTIAATREALLNFLIEGVITNRGLLLEVLSHPDFQENRHTTKWLETYVGARKAWQVKPYSREALIAVAVLARQTQKQDYIGNVLKLVSKARPPSLPSPRSSSFPLSLYGHEYEIHVADAGQERYQVTAEGQIYEVRFARRGISEWDLWIDHRQKLRIVGSDNKGKFALSISDEVSSYDYQITKPAGGNVEAPGNGSIKKIFVNVGDEVTAGQNVLEWEAMKLAQPAKAPIDGVVKEIHVKPNQKITEGDVLVEIEMKGEKRMPEAPRANFDSPTKSLLSSLLSPLPIVEADSPDKKKSEEDPVIVQLRAEKLDEHYPMLVDFVRLALLGYGILGHFSVSVTKNFKSLREPSLFQKRIMQLLALDPISSSVDLGVSSSQVTQEILTALEGFIDVELLFQKEAYRQTLKEPSLVSQFYDFLKTRQAEGIFKNKLVAALSHYGISSLEPSPQLDEALVQILLTQEHASIRQDIALRLIRVLRSLDDKGFLDRGTSKLTQVLGKFSHLDRDQSKLNHAAEGLLFTVYETQMSQITRDEAMKQVLAEMTEARRHHVGSVEYRDAVKRLTALPDFTVLPMIGYFYSEDPQEIQVASEAIFRRFYENRHSVLSHELIWNHGRPYSWGLFRDGETQTTRASLGVCVPSGKTDESTLRRVLQDAIGFYGVRLKESFVRPMDNAFEIIVPQIHEELADPDNLSKLVPTILGTIAPELDIKRITFTFILPNNDLLYMTFRKDRENPGHYVEDSLFRRLHPYQAFQIELWRLRKNFDPKMIPVRWEGTYQFLATEKGGGDQRLFAHCNINRLSEPIRNHDQRIIGYPEVDLAFGQAVHAIREGSEKEEKSDNHRIQLIMWPECTMTEDEIHQSVERLVYKIRGLGVQQTSIRFHNLRFTEQDPFEDRILVVKNPGGSGLVFNWTKPLGRPDGYIRPMSSVDRKVQSEARRRRVYPYEFINRITKDRGYGTGRFQEFDIENIRLERKNSSSPVVRYSLKTDLTRPPGQNKSGIVFGLVTRRTKYHPEGMTVMQIANDASNKVCPLEEGECARIIAAIDYAEDHGLEIDWKPTSSGAGISMTRGTENLDWTALVMKRIGEFCDRGGIINVLADGVNVGAQGYWIANAVMLPRRKGILIMTPESSVVLTGNEGQKIAGSVAAEDNVGLGGAERIMGPNGESHYLTKNVNIGMELVWGRRDLTWRREGEFSPALWNTADPFDRDISQFVYERNAKTGEEFRLGEILSDKEKKTPFAIELFMKALRNQDAPVLPQRWHDWIRGGADLIKVEEVVIGPYPAMLIGVEARPLPRQGEIPPGYPNVWNGSTLFPEGSKKMAHALNAASGVMPAVLLLNLSGFDGSPESLANCQLEWGTEIEEAVRKFQGRLVLLIVTRYHGGAYVVYSLVLNPNMVVGALKGTYASVIGEGPAAQLVFPTDINKEARKRIENDPKIIEELAKAVSQEEKETIMERVRTEVQEEYQRKYASIHTVERAKEVGSIHEIVEAKDFRPWIIRQLHEGRERHETEMFSRAQAVADSLSHYFGQKGPEGERLWLGMVMAEQMGPYLPWLRTGKIPAPSQPPPGVPQPSKGSLPGLNSTPSDPLHLPAIHSLGSGLRSVPLELDYGLVRSPLLAYREVDSTMNVIRSLADLGFNPGIAVVSDRQTQGRGQNGHVWESPPGTNLYLSCWINPRMEAKQSYQLSFTIAVAVAQTIRELTDANVQVKWPNDIYVEGRKICGILIEPVTQGGFVVGIGLNVNAELHHFGKEVARVATSLQMITGKKWEREQLVLPNLLGHLNLWLEHLSSGQWSLIRSEINRDLYQKGETVSIEQDRNLTGTIIEVAVDGALLLRAADGQIQRVYNGTPVSSAGNSLPASTSFMEGVIPSLVPTVAFDGPKTDLSAPGGNR